MNAKTKIFISILFASGSIFAQIGGISGSKLCVPSFDIVKKGTVEFEPSLSIFRAENKFSGNGNLETLSGENVSSNLAFRITTGISDNLEIGTSFTSDVSQVLLGAKYAFYFNDNEGLALVGGVAVPAGNKFIPDTSTDSDDFYNASIGGVLSLTTLNNLYIDGSVIYTKILGSGDFNSVFNYGVSFGYYVTEDLQPIIELSGFSANNEKYVSSKISLTYGLTLTISKTLLVVFGSQLDLSGRNEEKGINYFSAFTISIN